MRAVIILPMEQGKIHPILIIGAGPAGLSLAYHLKQAGHSPVLIEGSSSPGNSWREMPDFLSLISLWKSNYLIKDHRFNFSPLKQVGAKDFAGYLRNFAKTENFRIDLDTKVLSVKKEDGVFTVNTNRGTLYSRFLVNATGYYNSPFIPDYPGLEETEIQKLHFRNYKNYESLKGDKVLIVGSRLSAGQLVVDLVPKGFNISVSARSPITFMTPPPFFNLALLVVDFFEKPIQNLASKKIVTKVPMLNEAKKFFSSGKVKSYPAIKSFHKESVSFQDGTTEPFDSVIFSTGFRPDFSHLSECVELDEEGLPKLSDSFESLYCNNLFFLGLDHQNNIQSRFLRGIRQDAPTLSHLLTQRIKY